jgi:uncharacterized protein
MNGLGFLFLLFLAGVAGGALNAVAGGGSFIVFPTMVLGGIPPITANATTAVALWPAGLASVVPYREHLPRDRRVLLVLALASFVGGGAGTMLLLFTSDQTFAQLLPFLMLVAASVFTFGPRFTLRRAGRTLPLAVGAVIHLVIATYGGYFGGGMGIMILATLTLMGMTHLHEMNALKVVLGLVINGVALVGFLLAGKVVIPVALPVAIGSIAGGWLGAALARRTPPRHVRSLVLVVAWSLFLWFTYRALRR